MKLKLILLNVLFGLSLASCGTTRDYEVGTDREVSVGGVMLETVHTDLNGEFRKQMIYMGVDSSGVASVEYREFAQNYARPAFTERYVLDVSKSRNVVVKNLELEIVTADSKSVRFRVLRTDVPMRKDYNTAAPEATK